MMVMNRDEKGADQNSRYPVSHTSTHSPIHRVPDDDAGASKRRDIQIVIKMHICGSQRHYLSQLYN